MLSINGLSTWMITLGFILLNSCSNNPHIVDSRVVTNSKSVLDKPYLILISLDGFRWDYVERFKPPHLSAFIDNGVKAESLIPSYPSKTFPNHYTIVTGLYPDNHGIISNKFFNPELNLEYSIKKLETAEDGRFYGGVPIWVQAAKAGMVSASYFFLGSEAEIQGIRPSYYHRFNMQIKKETRVAHVLDWLKLPKQKRPHMITLYFPDMDKVGHRYGPDNDEGLKTKLFELDKHLGDLINGVKESNLPVNIIIVSDHGMSNVQLDKYITEDSVKKDELYLTINNGSMVNIYPKDKSQIESIFNSLKAKEKLNNFKVYKTENTPSFEYKPKNKNWGAIQLIPNDGYYFTSTDGLEGRRKSGATIFGQHGFDTKDKNMHGIFYANGPAFKKGYVLPSFKNIHLYPLMCEILGLDIPDNIDGNINVIQPVLTGN